MKTGPQLRLFRRATAFILANSILTLLLTEMAALAGTKTWNTTSGSLSAGGSWSPTGTPVTTDETLFGTGVTPAGTIDTAVGTNLSFGNLLWNNNTSSTIQINSTGVTSTQLRLTGGGGFTEAIAQGGATNDLLLMGTNATSNTLTISEVNPGGGVSLKLRLDASGNFNVVNSGATLVINTEILETGGAKNLTKTGAGTLTLSGTNTYTGTTTLSAGVLSVGTNANLGSATNGITFSGGTLRVTGDNTLSSFGSHVVTFTSGANVGFDIIGATTFTLSQNLTQGNGGLTLSGGSGTDVNGNINSELTLSGNNSGFTGTVTVNSGKLNFTTNASVVSSSNALVVNGGQVSVGAVFVGSSANVGSLSGTGGIIDATSGGTTGDTRGLTVNQTSNGIFSGSIRDATTLSRVLNFTKAGAATLEFAGAGANTYSGTTTVTGGELDLNKTAGVDAIAGNVTINGGTLKLLANNQIKDTASINMSSGAFSLNGQTETVTTFTNSGGTFTTGVGGHLTGTGATVTWSGGTNTVNDGGLVDDAHIVISGGTNTVEGGTTGGVLRLNSGGAGLEMSNGSTLTLNSDNVVAGKLLLDGTTANVSVTGNSTVTIANGAGGTNLGNIDLSTGNRTFTVADGTAATDLLVSAVITNGSMTKDGAGTMRVTADNNYTGTTTISGGTLDVGADGSLSATTNVTVNTGGTLLLSGTSNTQINDSAGISLGGGTITLGGATTRDEQVGALTLTGNSIIDFGAFAGGQTFRFADSSAISWTGTLSIYNWTAAVDNLYFGNGSTTGLTATQLGQISFYSDAGTDYLNTAIFNPNNGGLAGEVSPVPEPSAVVVGLALLSLVAYRERRWFFRYRQIRRQVPA